MMKDSQGQKLWRKAKQIIPGGNQLLSKRAEIFLPELWPCYYKKAKGCEVWDLDDNHYYDFATMGIGACAIGYADEDIDNDVIKVIYNGSMCTLNSAYEVELAEKLLEINPFADMVRFSRSGGEACSIAIRIARAATGKDKVAFCGYHGWHDWYLSTNIADVNNLNTQLLPGLKPAGVPKVLSKSILPFHYNNLEELKQIFKKSENAIGTIIMEPTREIPPEVGFLEGVRELADKYSAVLIFDEITSGFRMNFGGIYQIYNVTPDVVIYGKALGNGYPISAIIGKREIMDAAQETFISSTFWTEQVGFIAGLSTLKKMEKFNVQSKLIEYGERINSGWKKSAESYGLKIKISGIPPLTHLTFDYDNSAAILTLFTQEMLKRGYLAGSSVYTTYAYTNEIIDQYLINCTEVFYLISVALSNNEIEQSLDGPVKHSTFARLTH